MMMIEDIEKLTEIKTQLQELIKSVDKLTEETLTEVLADVINKLDSVV